MKSIIALASLLVLFSGCAAGDRFEDVFEGRSDARRACIDQARATDHNVDGVRSVSKEGRDEYTVRLDIAQVRETLTCEYDERSHVAQLHW